MSALRELIEERIVSGERTVALARHEVQGVVALVAEGASGPARAYQLGALILQQAELLEEANQALSDAHREYMAQGEAALLRWDTRGQIAADLSRLIWHAQGRLSEPTGPDLLRLYGLEEAAPAGLRALGTYAHNAITLLRAQPQRWTSPFGDTLDTEPIATTLERPLHALNDYLASLDDAPDAIKQLLDRRDNANERWLTTWRSTSSILEGAFLLAERADLAARVRPMLPGLSVHKDSLSDLDGIAEPDDLG